MAFHDVQFPTDISRGSTGGPIFLTTVVVDGGGAEQRIAQWDVPRRQWDITYGLKTPVQMAAVQSFFLARKGRLYGFRFKDWDDYRILAVDKTDTVQLTTTTFQLVKRYSSGGITYIRNITKPVVGTVVVYNAAGVVVASGWTVNILTGVITFSVAPGYLPKASFEFDVPVRFDTDQMKFQLTDSQIRDWDAIPIVELVGE